MPKLWDIALRRAEHEDMSLEFLLALNEAAWKAADPPARAIFAPAIARAYVCKDRGELASELLNLIRCVQGTDSIEKELQRADKRNAFSGLHAPVPDERFAAVWNRHGMETLKPRDRAKRLRKDLGSTSEDTALRRVRRMADRGWEMAGYEDRPSGGTKKAR